VRITAPSYPQNLIDRQADRKVRPAVGRKTPTSGRFTARGGGLFRRRAFQEGCQPPSVVVGHCLPR